jgi:hypothetical protein
MNCLTPEQRETLQQWLQVLYMCPRTTVYVLILPVSSYCCMCPHTTMCPHTAVCVLTLLCVLILLYVS